MSRYLYRGVNRDMYEALGGELRPKERLPFEREPSWGRAVWGSSAWGISEVNGVIEHQLHQAGYPTSGVSTTPHLCRAVFYATHAGAKNSGYVYVIDVERLAAYGVKTYAVNDYASSPSVPEDEEVILVTHDYGAIPSGVVVDVRHVGT